MMADFRHWLARKLLNLAFRVDRECTLMCDARMGWMFRRDWQQPRSPSDGVKAS